MRFEDALKAMREGKTVRRERWNSRCRLRIAERDLWKSNGPISEKFEPTVCDILLLDWEVCEPTAEDQLEEIRKVLDIGPDVDIVSCVRALREALP